MEFIGTERSGVGKRTLGFLLIFSPLAFFLPIVLEETDSEERRFVPVRKVDDSQSHASILALFDAPHVRQVNAPLMDDVLSQESFKPIIHEVKRGETLIGIAEHYGVPWQKVLEYNEFKLKELAKDRCADLPKTYTQSVKRSGSYCNELVFDANGEPMVHANTLRPGDHLFIPSPEDYSSVEILVRAPGALPIADIGHN